MPAAQNNTSPSTYVLGLVAASGASQVRAACVATDVKDVEYVLVVRGVNDTDAPGAWVALSTYAAPNDGNSATCYSDKALSTVITVGNYHWLEVGIRVRMKSTGSNPTGLLRIAASMSYT